MGIVSDIKLIRTDTTHLILAQRAEKRYRRFGLQALYAVPCRILFTRRHAS